MKARIVTLAVMLAALAAAFTPIASARGRWG